MEVKIDYVNLLLSRKVPKHGKVSGIKKDRDIVRVIVPNENTKLSLIVSEPSELLERIVTEEGKILGLTKFIGKEIYVLDQKKESLLKETGLTPVKLNMDDEKSKKIIQKMMERCEKMNIDPNEFVNDAIDNLIKERKLPKVSKKRSKRRGK